MSLEGVYPLCEEVVEGATGKSESDRYNKCH